jgi:hypothetical protein
VVLVADVLVAEEHHLVAQQGRADRRDDLGLEILAQVEARDLGPQHRAGGRDGQAGVVGGVVFGD